MASVTRRIEVCDSCREINRPIFQRVRIAPEGMRLRTVAFCEQDWAPMAVVLDSIREAWPTSDGRRQNRKVTLEQIETIKSQPRTRKRAAKKTTAPSRRPRKALMMRAEGS